MAAIERFEDILAWQAARELKEAFSRILRESRTFTKRSLIDQMERAIDSAMTNIVEGFEAGSDPEFIRFLKISRRSAAEFQSHLYTARDGGQITQGPFDELYEGAAKTKNYIGGFIDYLEGCVKARLHRDKRKRRKKKGKSAAGQGTGDGKQTEDGRQTEDGGQETDRGRRTEDDPPTSTSSK